MSLPFTRSADFDDPRQATPPPAGQVRVLVVGDTGVGKTSLVHLITQGKPTKTPRKTVGCEVSVKYVDVEGQGDHQVNGVGFPRHDSQGLRERATGAGQRDRRGYFVELWDVSGRDEYKDSRSIFYSQINGVIFVHDMSRRRSRVSALRWLAELSKQGTFSASSTARRPGLLPVPLLVVGNKGDIREIDPVHKGATKLWKAVEGSRGVQAARSWAERNQWDQWLGFGQSQELPDYIRNPHSSGLVACAKEGRLDMRAVMSFFVDLIERRYFIEHMPPLPSPSKNWTNPYFTPLSASTSATSTPPTSTHASSLYGTPTGSGWKLDPGVGPTASGGPSFQMLGYDPLLSTVYGARSKLVQLQNSTGAGGNSYEWVSSSDAEAQSGRGSVASTPQGSQGLPGTPELLVQGPGQEPPAGAGRAQVSGGLGFRPSEVPVDVHEVGAPVTWSLDGDSSRDSLSHGASTRSVSEARLDIESISSQCHIDSMSSQCHIDGGGALTGGAPVAWSREEAVSSSSHLEQSMSWSSVAAMAAAQEEEPAMAAAQDEATREQGRGTCSLASEQEESAREQVPFSGLQGPGLGTTGVQQAREEALLGPPAQRVLAMNMADRVFVPSGTASSTACDDTRRSGLQFAEQPQHCAPMRKSGAGALPPSVESQAEAHVPGRCQAGRCSAACQNGASPHGASLGRVREAGKQAVDVSQLRECRCLGSPCTEARSQSPQKLGVADAHSSGSGFWPNGGQTASIDIQSFEASIEHFDVLQRGGLGPEACLTVTGL